MSSAASIVIRRFARTILPARNIFTPSGIGIDQFLRIKELTAVRLGTSQASVRRRFFDDVSKDDRQIFSEDLKNVMYLAESDEEIDAVIKGLKKYYKHGVGYSNFHFGAPVMRMLTFHNKSEKAIETFMDQSLESAFKDSASCLVLMNHLIERRRYDDAVKVFNFAFKRGFVTATGKAIPSDVLMLVVEALYCQNTKESFAQLEKILRTAQEKNCNLTLRAVGLASLLAIKQGRPDVALEITGYGRNQNSPLFRNIKAICFADLGRPEEAMQTVRLIVESASIPGVSPKFERHVYPLVMTHIRKAVEKNESDPSSKDKFEELVKYIYNAQLMTNQDLEQFLLTPMNRTYLPQQQVGGGFGQAGGGVGQMDSAAPHFGQFAQRPSGYDAVRSPFGHQQQQQAFNQQPYGNNPFGQQRPAYQQQQQYGSFVRPPMSGGFGLRSTPPTAFGQQNNNTFQGRPPLRSPLAGAPPSTIRSFSNPTSNRPGPDDENL